MRPSIREALTNSNMGWLQSFLTKQAAELKISSFYLDIIRQWLNSVPCQLDEPFVLGPADSSLAASNKEIQLCDGKVIVNFITRETAIGCHTLEMANFICKTREHLSINEIVDLREEFAAKLMFALLDTAGRKAHILISDNYEKKQHQGPSLFQDTGAFADNWGNSRPAGWSKDTVFFGTMDIMDLIHRKCEEDPTAFGRVVFSPFTTNANYGKGSCRTCIWHPPCSTKDTHTSIRTYFDSMYEAWGKMQKVEPEANPDLTKAKDTVLNNKKKIKTPAPPGTDLAA
jgi:hypothetical protein